MRRTNEDSPLRHAREIIYVIRANGKSFEGPVKYVSENIESILGYSPSVLRRKKSSWVSLIHPDDVETFTKRADAAFRTGVRQELRYRVREKKSRKYKLLEDVLRPEIGDDGKRKGIIGSAIEALRLDGVRNPGGIEVVEDKEFWLNESQRVAKVGSYVYDIESGEWSSTRTLDEILGLGPRFKKNLKSWLRLIHPDDRTRVFSYVKRVGATRTKGSIECRIVRRKGGEERFIWATGEIVADSKGKPVRMFGIVQDITDRKRAEEALKESERLFHTSFENSAVGMVLVDLEGKFRRVNGRFCEMTGYTGEELLGMSVMDVTHPEDREISRRFIGSLASKGGAVVSIEKRHVRKDGRTIWTNVSSATVRNARGEPQYYVTNILDITERKTEEENRQRERILLKTLVDHLPDSVFVKDKEYRKIIVNASHVRRIALSTSREIQSPSDVIGKTDFEVLPRERAEAYFGEDQRVMRDGVSVINREERTVDPDGSVRWELVTKLPLKDTDGSVIGLLGIIRDITGQKETEEALERERILLRTLIDNLPNAIFAKDREYRKIIANPADADRVSKFSNPVTAGDLLGKTDFEVYPREFAEEYYLEDRRVIENGIPVMNHESLSVSPKGERHWDLISKIPLRDSQGEVIGLVGVATDITSLKETQEGLQREQTLLRTVIDNLPSAVFVKDTEYRKTIVNHVHLHNVICHLRGLGLESNVDIVGKTDFDIYPDEIASKYFADDQKVIRDGLSILDKEESAMFENNEEQWHLVSKLPLKDKDGRITGMVGITTDVTALKKAQEAQMRERILLKTIIDHLPNAIFTKDTDYRNTLVNPAHVKRMSEHIGPCTEEDLIGRNDFEICPGELAERHFIDDQKVIRDGVGIIGREMSETDLNGKKHWELVSKIPLIGPDGQITGMVGVSTDITPLREAEEALRESEAELRTLFSSMKDVVIVLDGRGTFLKMAPTGPRLFGGPAETLIGRRIDEFFPAEQADMFLSVVNRALDTNEPQSVEFSRSLDGSAVWFDASITRMAADKVLWVARDITERKQTEEALRKSEETLARITGSIDDAIYSVDGRTGEFAYLSPTFERKFGYSVSDIEAMGGRWAFMSKVVVEDNFPALDPIMTLLQEQMEMEVPVWENWWRCKDGSLIYVEDHSVPAYENGRLVRVDGVLRDVTERKSAEDAKQRERILLRTLIDNFPHAIYVKDREYRTIIANPTGLKYTGLPSEADVIGKTDFDMYPADVAEMFFADDQKVIRDGQPILNREECLYDAEGRKHWLLTSKIPLRDEHGTITGLVGVGMDVTERRQVDEALRQSEAELRALFNSMNDVILVMDADGRYLKVAPSSESLLYRPASEIVGRTNYEIFPKDQADFFNAVIHRTLESGETQSVEYAIQIKGEEKWRSASVSPMTENTVLWVARDITERKRMEKEITESERKYRELVENALLGVYKANVKGDFVYANKAMADVLEYDSPRAMMSASSVSVFKNEREWHLFADDLLRGGRTGVSREFELVTKNGKIRNVLVTASLDGDVVSGMMKDITDIRTLERQFLQTQKLEGLGNIAAGIAHDFNNILGVIIGYSELLGHTTVDSQKFERGIRAITKAADRGRSLVRQLLTFARKAETALESVNVNDIIAETERLITETFPKTIEVETDLRTGIRPVMADPTQIQQVLLNLCVNSRDAMPKGGKLTISTREITVSELIARHVPAVGEAYVEIQVGDTGIGMDEHTRQRIFEPFFTTKDIGKGTGLGLSVVYGIVESHGGFIDVTSRPGMGTNFFIYFPVSSREVQSAEGGREAAEDLPNGEGTLLVIEDEELLRDLLHTILVSRGYDVLTAKDGEEGLEQFRQNRHRISAVISDLGLPKLSGEEVVSGIREIDPSAKIVIASGFIDPEVRAELEKKGVDFFVQKPYKTSEVLSIARAAIEKKS